MATNAVNIVSSILYTTKLTWAFLHTQVSNSESMVWVWDKFKLVPVVDHCRWTLCHTRTIVIKVLAGLLKVHASVGTDGHPVVPSIVQMISDSLDTTNMTLNQPHQRRSDNTTVKPLYNGHLGM